MSSSTGGPPNNGVGKGDRAPSAKNDLEQEPVSPDGPDRGASVDFMIPPRSAWLTGTESTVNRTCYFRIIKVSSMTASILLNST